MIKDRRTAIFDRVMSLIITAICVVVGIMIIANFLSKEEDSLAISANDTDLSINVGVEIAEHGGITSYAKLYGNITTDSDPVAIYPDVSGEITAITVQKGDMIEKGDIIAYVDQTKPGYSYKESPVDSPVSGEVLSVEAAEGDKIGETSAIITVRLDEELKIETNVPERYIYALTPGTVSQFTVASYPGRTYEAGLTYISPVVDTSTRTAQVDLTITGDTTGLLEGMFATVYLAIQSMDDVITIPSSAIHTDNEGEYALVAINGIAERRGIETGLMDGTRTAILSGLNDGDQVIISGSASAGSEVSIVEGL